MHAEIDYERLYRDVIQSVVSVYVDGHTPGMGAGSGFVYDDHHVITNEHVVGDTEEVELRFADGQWRWGTVVGTDRYTDLAVVAVTDLPSEATPLPVAETNPEPGRPVAALGNPLGLDGSITAGIVSGSNRSMHTRNGFAIPDVVQTDAPINPGNSGGPLVALSRVGDDEGEETRAVEEGEETRAVEEGEEKTTNEGSAATGDTDRMYEVVGVNRAKSGDNIGFAISPAIVTRVVPALVATGQYRHSYLRTRTLDVTPTIAEANHLDHPRGVLVIEAPDADDPAYDVLRGCDGSRQLRGREVPVGGDVIVGIDGRELHAHEQLMRFLITETRPGDVVEVDVLRDGELMRLSLHLGQRPEPPERRQRSDRRRRRGRSPRRSPDDGRGEDGDDGHRDDGKGRGGRGPGRRRRPHSDGRRRGKRRRDGGTDIPVE